MRTQLWGIAGLVIAGVGGSGPTLSPTWDSNGHRTVAQVAWNHLSADKRNAAVALLKKGSATMRFDNLIPDEGTDAEKDQELFVAAATWPDLVRHKKYDHPTWHYQEIFWKLVNGKAVPANVAPQDTFEATERIRVFAAAIKGGEGADSTRAMQLAWILHLMGDIHQPLHNGSRVNAANPKGDHGGNAFSLNTKKINLHGYWDHALTREYPQDNDAESDAEYSTRLASVVEGDYPLSSLTKSVPDHIANADLDKWSAAALKLAQLRAYTGVTMGQKPPEPYEEQVLGNSERQIALAGYRLARLLSDMF